MAGRHADAVDGPGERQAVHAELARHRGPVGNLVVAADDPREVDPPSLHVALAVAQRRERNRQLGAPAAVAGDCLHLPDGAPVPIDEFLGDLAVVLRAHRIRAEQHAGLAGAEGVEDHGERVRLCAVVGHGDRGRVGFVADHADVESVVREAEVDLGALGRGRAAVGPELREAGERRQPGPCRIADNVAVHGWGLPEAHGGALGLAVGLRSRRRRQGEGEQGERRTWQQHGTAGGAR